MKFSKTTDKLWPALAAARKEIDPRLGKSLTANTGKFKYDYAPLEEVMEHVRPACEKHGLMIIQGSSTNGYDDNSLVAVSTAIIHIESGQYVRTRFAAQVGTGSTPAQEAGKVISYGRRYELFGLFGITPVGEDVDANAAGTIFSMKTPPPKKEKPAGKYVGPKAESAALPGAAPKESILSRFSKKGAVAPAADLPQRVDTEEGVFSYQPEA